MGDVRRRRQRVVFLALIPARWGRSGGAALRVGAGLLAVSVLAGCAQAEVTGHGSSGSAAPAATVTVQAITPAVRARTGVAAASRALARELGAAGLVLAPTTAGTYVRCDPGSAQVLYSADLVARPATRSGVAKLNTQMTAVLRAGGWQVAPVDLRKQHFPFVTVPHPASRMNRRGLHGALNVIPDQSAGSQAVVFVESPCFRRSGSGR
jgi:hypothetical protein